MEADNKKKEIETTTNKLPNAVVETYAGDMVNIMGNETEGLIKKIIHGEENKEAEKKNLSPESNKNKIFLIIGVLLLVFALSITFFFLSQKSTGIVVVQQPVTSLIFTNQNT